MRRVCGLDVHKDSIYMCILYENGSKIESVFGVLTPDLYSYTVSFAPKMYKIWQRILRKMKCRMENQPD